MGIGPDPFSHRRGRHLTVLFCDLVGATAIAAQLDPEEWHATAAPYHRTAAEAITRLGGHVGKYLGDGVMAFFGYPEAHDNDAERAARAGLAILEAIAQLKKDAAYPKLSARVGIDSGPAVVGAGAGSDANVFGDPPNIAARRHLKIAGRVASFTISSDYQPPPPKLQHIHFNHQRAIEGIPSLVAPGCSGRRPVS